MIQLSTFDSEGGQYRDGKAKQKEEKKGREVVEVKRLHIIKALVYCFIFLSLRGKMEETAA